MSEQLVGTVTHYFGKAQVAGIEITEGELHVGDTIHVIGHTSDFTQQIESMQIDRAAVEKAGVGDQIGIKVAEHAREHDKVYRVVPD
jgi:putative protease